MTQQDLRRDFVGHACLGMWYQTYDTLSAHQIRVDCERRAQQLADSHNLSIQERRFLKMVRSWA